MTGDELAAALYAEQGYMVIYSEDPLPIGFICGEDEHVKRKPATIKFRIIEKSSRTEYTKQRSVASRLNGTPLDEFPSDARYFYRVEAAD